MHNNPAEYDYDKEKEISHKLGEAGRANMRREDMLKFAAQYGIMWWMPQDDEELISALPIKDYLAYRKAHGRR